MSGRRFLSIACAALTLAGCGRADEAANNAAGPTAPKAVMLIPPATASHSGACAPAPLLALSQDFADPRGAFAPTTTAFHRLEADFAAAYRGACAHGVLRAHPLIAAGAAERDRLWLKNAPEANVVSIYLDGEEGAPAARRHMVLEYPFVSADGATHLPSANDLGEGIFCAVQGASQQEEEESGRCLPD